jgi:alpha-ketoglutarate-dependent taurine dioxygenase
MPKDLKHILDVYESEKLTFRWQRGDLMVLDNMLLAHGREPFKGQRKVAVAMTGDF